MKNFKPFLILLLVLYYSSTMQSQNSYNTLVYTAFCGEDEALMSIGINEFNQYKKEVENQEFRLKFNDSLAHFATIDKLDNSLPFVEIYNFTNSRKALQINKEDKIVLELNRSQQWNITSESKYINQFFCYKATSSYSLKRGDKDMTFPIIAWFCPALPQRFGPMGYGGLPGLILELQERNIVYGIKNITFDKNHKNLILPNFSQFQQLTETEWEAIILSRMKED